MTEFSIRPAKAADTQVIADFNQAMAKETEDVQLDGSRLLQGVEAILSDPGKGFYTVIEADGTVAGQMMITYEWSDWRNASFWWIQSVYVHPDYRRQGVFTQLYRHILSRADEDPGVCGVRLYVEHENQSAQNTYEQLGIRRAAYAFYEVDFVIQRSED